MLNGCKPFHIGDRVMAIGKIDGNDLDGKYGEVICYHPMGSPSIGVQFDEEIENGHKCDGTGKHGHCWYCFSESLTKITDEEEDDVQIEESEEFKSFLSTFKVIA